MNRVDDNTIILKEGDRNTCLYKVVYGSLTYYINYGKEDEFLIGVLGKGKCFGAVGFLSKQPSPYTYVTNSESLILEVQEKDFQDFVTKNPKNAIDIMTSMSKQVSLLQTHLSMLIGELNDDSQKKKMLTDSLKEKIKLYQTYSF